MRKLFCVMLVLVLSLGLASVRAEAPEAGMLLGGWTVAEDQTVTDELNSIFCQAMESFQAGTDPVACTPVACLGTQIVAGTNYAVLSKASEANRGTRWVIVYLYHDLQGNASVLEIAELPLGI